MRRVIPRAAQRSRKRRKRSGSKKNWVIARSAPASSLRFRLSRSASALGASGMRLRIGGDRDLEIGDAPEAGDQVGRLGETVRSRHVGAAAGRRIAAQRDDVAHALVPVARAMSRISPRLAPMQVRCGAPVSRVSRCTRVDQAVRAVTRRAVGAVGDRNETRGERREPLRAKPRASAPSLVIGGGKNSNETCTGGRMDIRSSIQCGPVAPGVAVHD